MSLSKMDAFGSNSKKATNLGMSKDRGKKVMITDEAIKKVPCIKYRGVPEYQYEIIFHLAQQVLEIAQKENNSNEVTITYSFDERLIANNEDLLSICKGEEHTINLMSNAHTYHLITKSSECAVVSLHNHPSLSLISLWDVRFFLYHYSVKLLVVISNLGSISYLTKSKTFDFNKASNLLKQAIDMHNNSKTLKEYQEAAKFFLKNCYKVGIIYDNK